MNALLVDVGNTRIKWRFDDIRAPMSSASNHEAVAIDGVDALRDAWRAAASWPIQTVVVSAVASEVVEADVERAVVGTWPGARIERIVPGVERGGIVNGYRRPSQLGPDRWLALIGARAALPGRSLLVCSFGTATTIDLLASSGDEAVFVGGMILPGLDAMRRALVRDTARLPDGRGRAVDFADNTDDAIETGLVTAQVGAVERAWRAAGERLGSHRPCCVLAGGAAAVIAPSLTARDIPYHPLGDAVLRGLAVCAREGIAQPSTTALD